MSLYAESHKHVCSCVHTYMYLWVYVCAYVCASLHTFPKVMGVLKRTFTFTKVHTPLLALDCEESGKHWPYKNGFAALLGQMWVMPPVLPYTWWSLTHQCFQVCLPLQAYINMTGTLHFKIKESGLISLF